MEKISLYIAGKKVDLDNNSFILFNYTMEDLSNPTIVKNSFSKQISLKGTPANNEVFGNLYRSDRKTLLGNSHSGVAFDPLRKTPFTIYNEMNEILESGYVKVDSVDKTAGGYEYKITLYGGLGSFFYNLMYKEDGSKKTLADIRYMTSGGVYTNIPGYFGQISGYEMLMDCWTYLENMGNYNPHDYENWWVNIINFAPAYNGLPDKFSADKALVVKNSFGNMPPMFPKTGASSNLMVFTNQHSEWEVKELRWYLQRPIISIKAIFDAASDKENNGGWDVSLDASIAASNIYKNAWMTLPMIPAEDRKRNDAVVRLLSKTSSPIEYLISFCKILGLVFLYNSGQKSIRILPRSHFYRNQVVDLSGKVSAEGIQIVPSVAESRIYQFGSNVIGEWAEEYKKEYGLDYAAQRVNTSYDFNNEVKGITQDIIFKDAAEVQERNLLFVSSFDRDEVVGNGIDIFRLPRYESVKLQQWKKENDQDVMEEVDISTPYEGFLFFDNQNYHLSDWLPKMQFHKGNKVEDGSEVLLLFNGVKETPQWVSWARLQYRLTDDHPDMELLNEGQPCWNLTDEYSRKLTRLPSFRRCMTEDVDGDDVIVDTFEWGEPLSRAVQGLFHDSARKSTIYTDWWKNYLSDRYDVDTRVMKCKVNLSGMQVGQELMRNFFFYDNALWVLNKISNYSMTTEDLTECEFIKVKDIKNYTEGQKL